MCEDVPDIDDLPLVLEYRDEPIFVASHVEHSEITYRVGVRKVDTNIGQMSPNGSLGYAVPMQQRFQSVRLSLAAFGDRRFTDDPHYLKVTKTVTTVQQQLDSQ